MADIQASMCREVVNNLALMYVSSRCKKDYRETVLNGRNFAQWVRSAEGLEVEQRVIELADMNIGVSS